MASAQLFVSDQDKKQVNMYAPGTFFTSTTHPIPEWDAATQRYIIPPLRNTNHGGRFTKRGAHLWRAVWQEPRVEYQRVLRKEEKVMAVTDLSVVVQPGRPAALKIIRAKPLHWSATNVRDPKRPQALTIANEIELGVVDEFGHPLSVTAAEAKQIAAAIQLRVTSKPTTAAPRVGAREAKEGKGVPR